MRSVKTQIVHGLAIAGMVSAVMGLIAMVNGALSTALAPQVFVKYQDADFVCYAKRTPLGAELQGTLSCLPRIGEGVK